MDLNTGRIYQLAAGEEPRENSVPIPQRLAEIYEGGNRHERRKLLAQQRRRHKHNKRAVQKTAIDQVIAEMEAVAKETESPMSQITR